MNEHQLTSGLSAGYFVAILLAPVPRKFTPGTTQPRETRPCPGTEAATKAPGRHGTVDTEDALIIKILVPEVA